MSFVQFLKKNRQTILMVLSLLLILSFFGTWIKNNPDLKAVKYEEMKKSGFDIFKGYHSLIGTLDKLLTSMDHGALGKLLYVGYLLILLPVAGVASLVLSGLRKKGAAVVHGIHYGLTFVPLTVLFLLILIIKDMRILFFSIFGFGFGYYLSMLLSLMGIVVLILTRKKKLKR